MDTTEESKIIAMVDDIFAESFEIDRELLKPEAHLFNDLGLDSLDAVDLVVAMQQKFGIRMRNDERIREVRTLADVHRLVLTVKKEQGV
jgi:acyl carrier protein